MIPQFTQGDRMRKAREEAGITTALAMAQRLKVDRDTIARWEKGSNATMTALLAYSAVCDVPLEWLVDSELAGVTRQYALVA